jgi:hypothetical protein
MNNIYYYQKQILAEPKNVSTKEAIVWILDGKIHTLEKHM